MNTTLGKRAVQLQVYANENCPHLKGSGVVSLDELRDMVRRFDFDIKACREALVKADALYKNITGVN
tara:strand:+ start:2879 stop:3079 length:201 start_codon:yes stop_codon:yes gene_type:complete